MTEFSRPVLAETAGRYTKPVIVDATPQECAAIAERLMIPAVNSLRCSWVLHPRQAGMIEGHGTLHAAVTQSCVVSLDPVAAVIGEDFTVHFVLEGRESEDDDPDAPDELVYDGVNLDLGEATVEQLALTLDPYPRKPGVEFEALEDEDAGGPFGALAKLRRLD